MPITIDIEKDTLYLQGIEKGRIKEKRIFVENLLLSTEFDPQRIASLAEVSLAFVEAIMKEIKDNENQK